MILWITGMSGAGKTTLAEGVMKTLRLSMATGVVLLDGDVLRKVWGDELGYTEEARRMNMGRMSRLCAFLEEQGLHAVAAVVAPFQETRDWNRKHFKSYYEVFIESPLESRVERDPKGLYAKALLGKEALPGVNQRYEIPLTPDLVINNSGELKDLLQFSEALASLIRKSS